MSDMHEQCKQGYHKFDNEFSDFCDRGCGTNKISDGLIKLNIENRTLQKKLSATEEKLKMMWVRCRKLESAEEKLKIAVEALEFYGDRQSWAHIIDGKYNLGKIWVEAKRGGAIIHECGARARSALTKIKGE